jgi:hypothetical protein
MPRTLLALLVALALTLGFVAATPADASAAPGADNVAKFCKTLSEGGTIPPEFEGVSQGGCVAFFTTGNGTPGVAGVCQSAAGREFVATLTGQQVRNTGQCVVIFKAFIAAEQP